MKGMKVENFGLRLKKLRTDKSLTVKEMAKRAGIPISSYREWEQGRKILGEPYPKMANALGVSLGELFGMQNVEQKEVLGALEEVKFTLYRLEKIIRRTM